MRVRRTKRSRRIVRSDRARMERMIYLEGGGYREVPQVPQPVPQLRGHRAGVLLQDTRPGGGGGGSGGGGGGGRGTRGN